MNELQIYVWDDVLSDYTDGLVVAVAASLEEAKLAADTANGFEISDRLHDHPKMYPISKIAFVCWGGG